MFASERKRSIEEYIQKKKSITVQEIVDRYEVSAVTVRKILTQLQEEGTVERTHGGAIYCGKEKREEALSENSKNEGLNGWICNKREDAALEMLEGYLLLYPNLYEKVEGVQGILRKNRTPKVAVIIGGGAGNEPWIIGYVGKGLADAAAIGNLYTTPPAHTIIEVSKQVDLSQGVVFLATNHTGDVMNFELAREIVEIDGVSAKCIFITDDIASAPKSRKQERRGVGGIALLLKVVGGASDAGCTFEDTVRIAEKANENIYTFGVTTMENAYSSFADAPVKLPRGEMEYGMGFNGETGCMRTKMGTADEIARTLVGGLLEEIVLTKNAEVVVMINGYKATGLMELCIMARKVKEILEVKNIRVHDFFVDSFFSAEGQSGLSISILVLDEELRGFYDLPAYSPTFSRFKNGIHHIEKSEES